MIHISGKMYELIINHKNAWDADLFRNRYSEVLERYDYIVGDLGYDQLRLKGFFADTHGKANSTNSFSSVSDYINEYCNFGCPYFVLQNRTGMQHEGRRADDIFLTEADGAERFARLNAQAASKAAKQAEAVGADGPKERPAAHSPRHEAKQESTRNNNHNSNRAAEQPKRKNEPNKSFEGRGNKNRKADREPQERAANPRPPKAHAPRAPRNHPQTNSNHNRTP